jgi:hypothetical protein
MTSASGPDRSPDLALADWGDLMSAVTARLGRIACALPGEDAADPSAKATRLFAASPREQLLDCLTALDQLQHSAVCAIARLPG